MPPLLTVAVLKGLGQHGGNQSQLGADHPTPGGITQNIQIDPGPPPLGQYAPAIPVRAVSPSLLLYIYSLSYCASDCRRCPTTTALVTHLFLTMELDLLEEI